MSENRRTLAVLAIAGAMAGAAWLTAPRTITPAAFQERGGVFFPEFTDPNAATSLEVVEFDEQTAVARPFKVLNRAGRWTIPSHHHYPADGQQRLSQTAAAIIALTKSDVATDRAADHERLGVLDPLDEALPTPRGRGTRLIVKGQNEKVLADIIVGRDVEQRKHLRYARIPGQKRTYVANVGALDISTRFNDWIDRDLLQVDRADIDSVIIRNYSLNRQTGQVTIHEVVQVNAVGLDRWALAGMSASEQMNTFNMNLLITKLDELAIVDVRPKPEALTAMLASRGGAGKLARNDVAELGTKGFYLTSDAQLLSNQGEVLVHTTSGIFYTLRFGELASGAAVGVADARTEQGAQAGGDARYMFISVGLDERAIKGEAERQQARQRLELLRTRFAPWYYVIPAESVMKIRLQRRDLVQRAA